MGDKRSDLLGKLTGAPGETDQKKDAEKSATADTASVGSDTATAGQPARDASVGLNALELLNLPGDQRKVITIRTEEDIP